MRSVAVGAALLVYAAAAVAATEPTAASLAALGRELFFDPALSASGRLACASCHDPHHAYGPPDGRAVQPGGAALQAAGLRAVPALRYTLRHTPVWSKQYQASAVERVTETDSVPGGGFDWDGRFASLHEQAASPLLSPQEMGNVSVEAVVAKLRRAPYAAQFRALWGPRILDEPRSALGAALQAIERFELDDASFHPYSSRFDAYLDGKATLSAAELRGLRLFNDPRAGNCSACHTSATGADGSHPLFTDFSFAALGVPRNPEIPANADPGFYDLGLCGPLRTDLAGERRWCGMFKTPTLRNAAARGVYFHNGRMHTLRDAVRFYAERDRQPGRYDDLPAALQGNVDHRDAPFDRKPGDAAALSAADVDDLVAFIATLNDADLLR
jgi:cytochrome c peroxidase